MAKSRGEHTFQIKVNLSPNLRHKVGILAQERRIPLGTTLRAIVEQYFVMEEQQAEERDQIVGVVGLEMARLEKRMQESLVTVSERVETVAAMVREVTTSVDEFAKSYFLHTPEVPTGKAQIEAVRSGLRRHKDWQKRTGRGDAE